MSARLMDNEAERVDAATTPSSRKPAGIPKSPLRSALASLIKELIWKGLLRFSPRKKPIGVYASRRSGSTLLMETIAVNSGVMFSDQPFSLFTASSANLNRLPILAYGQLACLDRAEEEILAAYISELLAGRIKANAPWKLWSSEFHFSNDRICLKITDAKAMIDWIDERFELCTLVSTRHPIAQALSVANLGWLTTGKGFLRNAGYVERWLSSDLEQMCWEIYRTGSDLEQRIADWALENLPMLSLLPEKSHWSYLSYEELIAQTDQAVQYLGSRLQLDDIEQMKQRVARPSRSTRRESTAERRSLIRQGDRRRLLNLWRDRVSDREAASCYEILQRFGLQLYRPDSDFPDRGQLGLAALPKPDQDSVLPRQKRGSG